ncbi:MAG: hypothetical protein WAU32_02990 [Thermoanaerobaculia bacterium]
MNGSPRDRRGLNLGIALTAVGIYFLLSRQFDLKGPGPILLLIGTVLFAASALGDFRGPIVPACVCLGLGAGFLLRDPFDRWMPGWATLLLCLGGGFLLATAILRSAGGEARHAPLVPGVVLVAIALATVLARNLRVPENVYAAAWKLWPWALVAAGAVLVLRALRRRA